MQEGLIVLCNPAATKIFGYEGAGIRGMPITVLVPEELHHRHLAGIERFRSTRTGPLIEAPDPVEVPAVREDGSVVHIELTLTPLADVEIPRDYVLALVRDVRNGGR